MTLEEILLSDAKITKSLLEENSITLEDVFTVNKTEIDAKRYLDVLYIMKDKKDNDYLRFLIMFYNIRLNNFEEAYKYAKYLHTNAKKYVNDAALYVLLLEEILGLHTTKIKFADIMVDRNDYRFYNPNYQNEIRANIFDGYYEKAQIQFRKLFSHSLNWAESTIYLLLKALNKKEKNKVVDAIENLDLNYIYNNLSGQDLNNPKYEDRSFLADMLNDVVYGLPLEDPEALPKAYTVHDAIRAKDLDKVAKIVSNEEIITSFVRKIKEVDEENKINDYKGILRSYLCDTLEDIYACIEDKRFDQAEDIIWAYLEAFKKDEWIFYILNRLIELESSYDSLTEEEILSRISEIFELIIEVTKTMSAKTENMLIEKYMAPKEVVHPYSKINDIDIEYNYNIEGIEDIIEGVKNNTIDYSFYATKSSYKEEDLFVLAIMARENYRNGNFQIGDTLIKIVEELLTNKGKEVSELRFFVKAIKKNKDLLVAKKRVPFSEEVKMLLIK